MREIRTSGLMSGEGKRSAYATPRLSSTLLALRTSFVLRIFLSDTAPMSATTRLPNSKWPRRTNALSEGRAKNVKVTPEQARVVDDVVNRLEAVGSGELRKAIQAERSTLVPGLNLAQALLRKIDIQSTNGR